jgi:hypothetical protein
LTVTLITDAHDLSFPCSFPSIHYIS